MLHVRMFYFLFFIKINVMCEINFSNNNIIQNQNLKKCIFRKCYRKHFIKMKIVILARTCIKTYIILFSAQNTL